MNELSLDNINSISPYRVDYDDTTKLFKFVSDYHVGFSVAFDENDLLQSGESYHYAALIIRRDNPKFNDLVTEFTNTITMLNSKPETNV